MKKYLSSFRLQLDSFILDYSGYNRKHLKPNGVLKKFQTKSLSAFGFTLIELMVVIGISMVIGAASLAAYSNFNSAQQVDQTAFHIVSMFEKARFSALSNTHSTSCNPGFTSTTRYGVVILSSTTYRLRANCRRVFPAANQLANIPPIFTVPRSVTITAGACPGGSYYYESIRNLFFCHQTSSSALSADTSITVTNTSGTRTKTINITRNGQVTVN